MNVAGFLRAGLPGEHLGERWLSVHQSLQSRLRFAQIVECMHPLGARPFARANYIHKFQTLTKDLISREESERFIKAAQRLGELKANELGMLNVVLPPGQLTCAARDKRGIF